MIKLIALPIVALAMFVLGLNSNYFEDASFRVGPVFGCLPGGICSQPDGLYLTDIWVDPWDGKEAIYVGVPGACSVDLDPTRPNVIIISLCEDIDQ